MNFWCSSSRSASGHVNGAVVEGQHAPADGGVIHSQRAARIKTRVKAVLDRGLHVLGQHLLLILVLKPLVRHLAVAKILVGTVPP